MYQMHSHKASNHVVCVPGVYLAAVWLPKLAIYNAICHSRLFYFDGIFMEYNVCLGYKMWFSMLNLLKNVHSTHPITIILMNKYRKKSCIYIVI